MNEVWSDLNKSMQQSLKKKDTYEQGITTLLSLRELLMNKMMTYKQELSISDFSAIPFINAKGYHCKTIAYSLWHIFRIEDIITHSLIQKDEQVFFQQDFQKRMNAPIITTGNELVKQQIADFSRQLELEELYQYITEVKRSTDDLLRILTYDNLKEKFTDIDKKRIIKLNVVSKDENASWLIDYWCSKDVKGLIQMPFSRHWIMHVEACERMKSKL